MAEQQHKQRKPGGAGAPKGPGTGAGGDRKSVYGDRKRSDRSRRGRGGDRRSDKPAEEYEQRIIDLARVTRVMAGGKRMRFRACVAIGNRKGKVALGIDKGADVTLAVTKAVNNAKKRIIEVPIVNDTIPHAVYIKVGAAKLMLKPAGKGRGVIAGGAARIVLEMSGIKNISAKILGTNNNINVAKSAIEALASLKKVEPKPKAAPQPAAAAPAPVPAETAAVPAA